MRKSAVASLVVAGLTLVPLAASAASARPGVIVSKSVAVALSAPLSQLAAEAALAESDQDSGEIREINNQALPAKGDGTAPYGGPVVDPVRQSSFPLHVPPYALSDPLVTFEGIGMNGSLPPDTVGAVGPNNYVQAVNTRVGVWSKTGTVQIASTPINSLFSALPGGDRCRTNNDGDPDRPLRPARRPVPGLAVRRLAVPGVARLQPVHRDLPDRRSDRQLVGLRLRLGDRPAQRLPALRHVAGRLLRHVEPVQRHDPRVGRRGDHGLRARGDARRPDRAADPVRHRHADARLRRSTAGRSRWSESPGRRRGQPRPRVGQRRLDRRRHRHAADLERARRLDHAGELDVRRQRPVRRQLPAPPRRRDRARRQRPALLRHPQLHRRSPAPRSRSTRSPTVG